MYAENVGQYDEIQMLKAATARLNRNIVAKTTATAPRQAVYPQGYLPPEVEHAKQHHAYLKACDNYSAWHLHRRRNQGKG